MENLNMQKCPYCHSNQITNLAYEDCVCGNVNAKIELRRRHKFVSKQVTLRVCLDCGGIFVNRKDCDRIKSLMESELKESNG